MNKNANDHKTTRRISFWGDSLTRGTPGASFFKILKRELPEYELLNYGKGGDTAISLYRRIEGLGFNTTSDIAFLWVGTNDVFAKISWSHTALKIVTNQPRAKDHEEFERYYQQCIEILWQNATRVVTVPPLFMGEDLHTRWNQEMEQLASIIEQVSASYDNVEFLDLRKRLLPKLEGKTVSNYFPNSITRIALDTMLLKYDDQVEQMSTMRSLSYTLDGVHLNCKGAELVAGVFLETIQRILPR